MKVLRKSTVLAGMTALGLLGGSCGSTSTATPPTTTTAVATTTTMAEDSVGPLEILDPAFLSATLERVTLPGDRGTFMFAVFDEDGDVTEASIGSTDDGATLTADDSLRIGSITKIFTSLTIMTLVEDGLIDLDAPAADYVTRVPVPENVTVRNLLQHRSGIFNYTDLDAFFGQVFADSERVWTEEEIVGFVGEKESLFEPGDQFSYSNTNYIILGVLIEEVSGEPYHQLVRDRIIDPLRMESTYLSGREADSELFSPFQGPGGIPDPDYEYTSIATSAWAAGAMVSTAGDLHQLFTAMYDGRIVTDESVEAMTAGDDYGFGLELWEKSDGIVGHGGGIPGYFTFLRYSPETGITAFLASTADMDPGPAIEPMLAALGDADD